jgi:anti-sigma regulatory factor (Ser/Thr protein kinase)
MTDDPHHQPQAPDKKPTANAAKPAGPDVPGADVTPILAQDFDAGSLYALRAAVSAHATQAGIPGFRADDVVLAVHELAANAIRHGAGRGRLVITKRDSALHCQVTDDGALRRATTGTTPEAGTAFYEDIAWPSQHGHGLWVVRQIADHVHLQTGSSGTIASASFTLPSHSQQPPAP